VEGGKDAILKREPRLSEKNEGREETSPGKRRKKVFFELRGRALYSSIGNLPPKKGMFYKSRSERKHASRCSGVLSLEKIDRRGGQFHLREGRSGEKDALVLARFYLAT